MIYCLLINADHDPFYVGATTKATVRLNTHKYAWGNGVTMRIVQDTFPNETVCEAERKWVRRCLAAGCTLINEKLVADGQQPINNARSSFSASRGRARAKKLSGKRRSEIARKAANTRWKKAKTKKKKPTRTSP